MLDIQCLKQLGLNHREAVLYLICVELGPAKASDIAKKARLGRDASYFYLNALVKKGLLRENKRAKIKKFVPENPMVMIERFEKEMKVLEEKKHLAEQMAGKLLPVYYGDSVFRISLIDGEEGFELIRQKALKCRDTIRDILPYDAVWKEKPLKGDDTRLKFIQRPFPYLTIATSKNKKGLQKSGSMIRYFLPIEKYKIEGMIEIFEDLVIISHFERFHRGVVIQDAKTASVLKLLFDLSLSEVKRIAEEESTKASTLNTEVQE